MQIPDAQIIFIIFDSILLLEAQIQLNSCELRQ